VTSPRAPRWRWIIAAAAVLAASPATSSAHPTTITQRPSQTAPGARLELVEQRFAVDPNGDMRLRYVLTGLGDGDPLQLVAPSPAPTDPAVVDPATPPGSDPATSDPAGFDPATSGPATSIEPEPEPDLPALTLEITNYQPLADSDDVARLVGSGVDPDAFTDVVDGVAIDARPLLTPNDDGTVELTLDVGTDVVDSVESRLKMDRPGLYPVRIQLLVGDPDDDVLVATAGTVVQRLAGALDIDVAVAPPIDLSVVTVTPGMPPGAEDEAIEAREGLDRAIELAATLGAPVTLEVPPTLIAEAATTAESAERLAVALADDELVALPIVPLDVSSAVAAGRADSYTRLVIAGEELIAEAVPTTPVRRDVWIISDPLSAGGAQHLRDLGTRFVVIPAAVYEDSIDDDLPPTDRFVEAELPDGSTLPFLVVGPVAEQLTQRAADRILAGSTAVEWGVETLAEMLVEQALDDAEASSRSARPPAPPRRSRILTTPDLTSPDARLLQALTELAATTPSVRFTPASALTGVTDVALDDGEPVTIRLPDVAGPSLDARIELLDDTALELASAASMLPDDDPRPTAWSTQLDVLISTGYSDAEVETAVAELVAEAVALEQAVELPEPFTFTLTGRSGTIEVRIGNTIDEPLDVVVELDSAKITFPEGAQRVTLRPLDETSVIVPVEAEANGTSSINLVVSTPAGEALGEPVTLTARVTALTGLGQVLTGGFVLVLLTWWFTHWRNRRRAELVGDGRDRHPSSGKVESSAL
jgi:hypothetical protein